MFRILPFAPFAALLLAACASPSEICDGALRKGLDKHDFQAVWGKPDYIEPGTGEPYAKQETSEWSAPRSDDVPSYEVWEYENRQIQLWFLPHKDLVKWVTPLTPEQLAAPRAGDTGKCAGGK